MVENKKFIVTCDSACDMSKEFIDSLGAYVIPFEYTGKVGNDVELYIDTMNANDYKEFYDTYMSACDGHAIERIIEYMENVK